MKTVLINKNIEIAPDIYAISFRREFDFIPGQVLKITADNSVAPRMYSIASGTHDPDIQLIYDIKPEGQLTNILRNLKSGDKLLVSAPLGNFTWHEGKAWWIATGTGIAPFYSMLRSGSKKGVTLLHGVRKPENALFRDEFSEKLEDGYFPCCSGKFSDGMFKGRVTDYLLHCKILPVDANFYLCGSAEMVVDVRDLLIDRKVPFGNIYSEIYF
jgi:ferredoxin--NADP+ reductase